MFAFATRAIKRDDVLDLNGHLLFEKVKLLLAGMIMRATVN